KPEPALRPCSGLGGRGGNGSGAALSTSSTGYTRTGARSRKSAAKADVSQAPANTLVPKAISFLLPLHFTRVLTLFGQTQPGLSPLAAAVSHLGQHVGTRIQGSLQRRIFFE